jgi:NADPH-dependent 2,4-dienoyl-CoA reductase/sulfur reductase-like enzyme
VSGRVAIVGASLAGLRGAEALRAEGFDGEITIIGDEPYEPYDRPPLSKQVLTGWVDADKTGLPHLRDLGKVDWRLGTPASGLDLDAKQVKLADGATVDYDQVLIATGVRNRPWPNADEAALDGVFSIRTRDDSEALSKALAQKPKRVIVVGAGFTGSEVSSICRQRGLDVTCLERGGGPLVGALGGVIAEVATGMHNDAGVDLRCGVTVEGLEGVGGKVRGARLSDGSELEADVVVIALGSVRNTEWLLDSGLAAGPLGVACDAGSRAITLQGLVTDDVFAAGDVARFPHAAFGFQLIALEHWENAVLQAQVAAHNMVCSSSQRRAHLSIPAFWSIQFEVNIKSVGAPAFGEEILVTQGDPAQRRFAAAYGRDGRVVAAVTFNHAKWLEFYRHLIETAAPFPDAVAGFDGAVPAEPVPAAFPGPGMASTGPTVVLTGHDPSRLHAERLTPTPGAS